MSESDFKVILVGAGEINFGSVEGPWNHSVRLERKLGTRLQIVALIDPDENKALIAVQSKLKSAAAASAYQETRVFASVEVASASLAVEDYPRLIILGTPPFSRGSDLSGQDLELQIIKSFPQAALFVEKPVTSGPPEATWRVAEQLSKANTLVSVGYVLRYLKAVQKMKEIIEDNKLVVMGTNARYIMAYEYARNNGGIKLFRVDATHFCDLSRYFGGQVRLPSITAHTVEYFEPPGQLSAKRFVEEIIPPENRIPRLTSASWKYENGAVGSLMHVVALHGTTYDTEIEVFADGYRFKLTDPYNFPVLSIRKPGLVGEEIYKFEDDDPFYTEISEFVDMIESGKPDRVGRILSSYEDAVATYEFTARIRGASDKYAQSLGHGLES